MKNLIALVLLVLAASLVQAQEPWQRLGPAGVDVAGMATVPGFPDEIFLVTAGYPAEVFHTRDLGLHWEMLDTIQDQVHDLVLRPDDIDILFAVGRRGLVRRSADGGRTWYVRGTLAGNPVGRRLALKTGEPDKMWAAAEVPGQSDLQELGIYQSTDAGSSWDPTVLDSGYEVKARLLVADPVRANRVFAGGGIDNRARLFRSDDGGENWQDISNGIGGACAWDVATSPVNENVLVCGTDAGIFRSTDAGASWQQRSAVPAWSVEFAPASPHPGYASSDNLVFRSEDNGQTWSAETTDYSGSFGRRLATNPIDELEVYSGNGAGVFHSTNGGFDWMDLNDDLQSLTVPWLWFLPWAPDTVYACPTGLGIVRSTDRGQTWTRVHRFAGDGFVTGIAVNPRDPDTVFCVTSFDSRLRRTTDRGDSWLTFPIADRFVAQGICLHPSDPDTMYVWGGQRESDTSRTLLRVLKTSDRGMTWTRLLARGLDQGFCRGFAFHGGTDTLFAWGEADGFRTLYRSTNRGEDWSSKASGISGPSVRDFAVSPADPATWFAATPNGVFRTTDHGETWDDIGLGDVSAVLPDTSSPDAVMAGTDTAGIYWTTDAGLYWERDTVRPAPRAVLELYRHPADPAAVYCCASGEGVIARGVVGIREDPAAGVPPRVSVRPTLVRETALVPGCFPATDRVMLRLFQPDGRAASGPLPVRRTASGLAWSRPPGLAPGIYLLRLELANSAATWRVVLTP